MGSQGGAAGRLRCIRHILAYISMLISFDSAMAREGAALPTPPPTAIYLITRADFALYLAGLGNRALVAMIFNLQCPPECHFVPQQPESLNERQSS